MIKTLYVLPNQLFENVHIPSDVDRVILWEHPDFFTKYNFNKKKLILHRASMKYYFDKVIKRNQSIKSCKYIEFSKEHTPSGNYIFFDPINEMNGFSDDSKMLESPNFFMTKSDYETIYKSKKSKSSISFTRYFYPRCKQVIQFLQDQQSTDHDNRKGYDRVLENLLQKTKESQISGKEETSYIKEAVAYVNKHFQHNYGKTEGFNFPISRAQALNVLNDFIKNKLVYFGPYQDTFSSNHDNMFHSILSSSLNIGILHPKNIIDKLQSLKLEVPINSLEGYVRQLCWREYQRYVYIYYRDTLSEGNFFELRNKIDKKWYDGTTPMLPVNNCIHKAFDTAYLHHIERLMIIGNYMVLSEIKPQEGFRWFMEFAIDSYEWVMVQNVYDMVFFNGNGMTSYKPYITSNSYLIKMSNYSASEEWNDKWNALYKSFVMKHKKQLYKYRYHFKMLRET